MRNRIEITGCCSRKTEFDNIHDSSTPGWCALVTAAPFCATSVNHSTVQASKLVQAMMERGPTCCASISAEALQKQSKKAHLARRRQSTGMPGWAVTRLFIRGADTVADQL